MNCDHKFIDSNSCAKCGAPIGVLRTASALEVATATNAEQAGIAQQQKLELAKLRDAFLDALALLRDWEDFDPNDDACTWETRRDSFLAEHEGEGR
jgi:hypothetical protein